MKKFALLLIACTLSSVFASAQIIIGGGLNFSASSQKSTSLNNNNENLSKNPSTFSFGIAPKVGYIINDTWEVGAKLDLKYNQTINYIVLRDEQGDNPKAYTGYR